MATKKEPSNKVNPPEHSNPVIRDLDQEFREKEEMREFIKKLRQKSGKIEPVVRTSSGELKKASTLTIPEQEQEFIKCATDPIYFIETYLTIFDQTKGKGGEIVPFRLFDFQKDLIDSYLNNRFVIANKYRQAGISTSTCAYISWYVMFNPNRSVAIVADKLETARDELMNDVVEFIENCPTWLRPKTGKESFEGKLKDTQKLKRYDNGSTLSAFSSKGLRGYTPTLLFWDETAWTEKGDKFWTSAQPTLQTGGSAIMVSTPAGLDPVFYKTFDGARRGENNFKAVLLYWFNDPRYNKDLVWLKNKGKESEIRLEDENFSNSKRIQLMDDGWEASSPWYEEQVRNANGDMRKIAQEILGSFLGSGDNFIAEEFLKRIEDEEIRVPIRQEYNDKNMWIFEDAIPDEEYIVAVDASPGHGEDNSTINILKRNEIIEEQIIKKNGRTKKVKVRKFKVEQVAEYYGKIAPQSLAEIAYIYAKAYNNGYVVVDITGGYGIQTVNKLLEIGYENIHYAEVNHKPSRDMLAGYVKQGNKVMPDGKVMLVDLIPGFFIGNNRSSVLLELQRSIHLSDVIIHSVRLLNELKTFITVPGNRVADHKRSFHDDSIMGLAIGLFVINYDMAKFKESDSLKNVMMKSFLNVNKENKDKIIKKQPTVEQRNNPYGANAWLFSGMKQR
ncbi:MAG: terminase large subunit domain-containing protein [bacterium]